MSQGGLAERRLWSEVEDVLLAIPRECRALTEPVVLHVDDPIETAARCWDAGFTVHVGEPSSDSSTLVVTDPFGGRVVLTARETATADDSVFPEEPL